MIIVSQERDIIVNFDRIESIWINDNVLDNTRCRFSIVAIMSIVNERDSYKSMLEEKDKQIDLMAKAWKQDDIRSTKEIKQYFKNKAKEDKQ